MTRHTRYHDGAQVVWITGASSGIGEALALEYAATNATLVLSARREERLKRVAAEALALGASAAHVLPLDVVGVLARGGDNAATAGNAFDEAVAQVLGMAQRVDVLVLNAGATQRSLAEDTSLSATRKLMELNFFGVIEHARAALSALRRSKGHIVVVSSFTGTICICMDVCMCVCVCVYKHIATPGPSCRDPFHPPKCRSVHSAHPHTVGKGSYVCKKKKTQASFSTAVCVCVCVCVYTHTDARERAHTQCVRAHALASHIELGHSRHIELGHSKHIELGHSCG